MKVVDILNKLCYWSAKRGWITDWVILDGFVFKSTIVNQTRKVDSKERIYLKKLFTNPKKIKWEDIPKNEQRKWSFLK